MARVLTCTAARSALYTYAWDTENWRVRKVYPHFAKSDQLQAIIDFDPFGGVAGPGAGARVTVTESLVDKGGGRKAM